MPLKLFSIHYFQNIAEILYLRLSNSFTSRAKNQIFKFGEHKNSQIIIWFFSKEIQLVRLRNDRAIRFLEWNKNIISYAT